MIEVPQGGVLADILQDIHRDGATAEQLFPNQGLHAAARVFATAHTRGLQYLEQAPVIVLGACHRGVGQRRINGLYIQHLLTPLAERGAPLADVMRKFGIAAPFRKLKPSALSPSVGPVVLELSKLDPRVLGNIIPATAGKQRLWLRNIRTWRDMMRRRAYGGDPLLEWAAANVAGASEHRVCEVVDYIVAEQPFNPAWGWRRAEEETIRWHSRITVERNLRGSPIAPDTPIDLGPHPDTSEAAGYDFVALRTPYALAEEGAIMQHCVGTYINTVLRGKCSIVSVRRGSTNLATVEISNRRIQQIKGPYNAVVPDDLLAAARRYVKANFADQPT